MAQPIFVFSAGDDGLPARMRRLRLGTSGKRPAAVPAALSKPLSLLGLPMDAMSLIIGQLTLKSR